MDINKVTLIGNLTQKPEGSTLPSGQQSARFDVATKFVWSDRATKKRKERSEFHTVVVYGSLAEIALRYLERGSRLYVEGHLVRRGWQDTKGQKRRAVEIVADELIMLGRKQGDVKPVVESPPAV